MKEVVDGPMIGIEVTMDKFGLVKGSALERDIGESPLIESIDVAGDTPAEGCDRLFRGYWQISNEHSEREETLHMNF